MNSGRMRRNVVRLMSGSVLAQVIVVAATPLLTRLFGAESFGVMAVFSATYAIAIPVATLKFDAAVVLPKSDRAARSLSTLAGVSAALVSMLCCLVLLAWFAFAPKRLPVELGLLPLSLCLGALYTVAQQWSARAAHYNAYSRSQVFSSVVNVSFSVTCGAIAGGRSEFMVLAFVFGTLAGLFGLHQELRRSGMGVDRMSLPSLWRRAQEYRQFPLLVLPSTLVAALGVSGTTLILAGFYNMKDIGAFAVSNRLMMVPAAIIGTAFTEAFRAEFVARIRSRQQITHLFLKTMGVLVAGAVPAFALLAATAPWLFALVLGREYEVSGVIAQDLALAVCAQFMSAPFVYTFVALRRSSRGLYWQIAFALLPALALLIAAHNGTTLGRALLVYSYVVAALVAFMFYAVFKECSAADSALKAREVAA